MMSHQVGLWQAVSLGPDGWVHSRLVGVSGGLSGCDVGACGTFSSSASKPALRSRATVGHRSHGGGGDPGGPWGPLDQRSWATHHPGWCRCPLPLPPIWPSSNVCNPTKLEQEQESWTRNLPTGPLKRSRADAMCWTLIAFLFIWALTSNLCAQIENSWIC